MNDLMTRVALYVPALLHGVMTTFTICLFAIVLGIGIALVLNGMLNSPKKWLNLAAKCYISFFRGTPVLGQLLMFYYVPTSLDINISAYVTSAIVLALNTASYQAIIYKSGFDSITPGQIEAAQVFSISKWNILIHIQLPHVFRATLPALISELIDVVKVSSLISVISVTEIMRISQQLVSQTYRPLEVYSFSALTYLCITSVLTLIGFYFERKWRIK